VGPVAELGEKHLAHRAFGADVEVCHVAFRQGFRRHAGELKVAAVGEVALLRGLAERLRVINALVQCGVDDLAYEWGLGVAWFLRKQRHTAKRVPAWGRSGPFWHPQIDVSSYDLRETLAKERRRQAEALEAHDINDLDPLLVPLAIVAPALRGG